MKSLHPPPPPDPLLIYCLNLEFISHTILRLDLDLYNLVLKSRTVRQLPQHAIWPAMVLHQRNKNKHYAIEKKCIIGLVNLSNEYILYDKNLNGFTADLK